MKNTKKLNDLDETIKQYEALLKACNLRAVKVNDEVELRSNVKVEVYVDEVRRF